MPHQGGVTSPLSTELGNLRRKAKRGHTEGKPPRLYTDDELEWFAKREKEILAQQTEEKEARLSARMNEHTTKQIDRAIQASKEHTRHSETFFSAIGGAGSSNDLQIQGQAMLARARHMKHDEKAATAATSRAAKQTERLSAKALKEAEKKAVKAFKETEKAETAEKKVAMKVQAGRKRKGKTDATESTSAADETSSLGTELPIVPVTEVPILELPIIPVVSVMPAEPAEPNIEEMEEMILVEDIQSDVPLEDNSHIAATSFEAEEKWQPPDFMKAPEGMTITEELNMLHGNWPKESAEKKPRKANVFPGSPCSIPIVQ